MDRPRFGEALARFVTLTTHDVSEILEDQGTSRRRFGDIALAFGLCQPQHVWRAWWAQLSGAPPRVDLDAVGIDVQALIHLPRALAIEYTVIPVRASGSQVVMAAAQGSLMRATEELPRRVKIQTKFVLADAGQIQSAIETLYGQPLRREKLEAAIAIPA